MANIEPLYVVLGRRIRSERVRLKITQDELSECIGLPRTAISNIEAGRQRLLVHTLLALSRSLGVLPAELLQGLDGEIEGEVDLEAGEGRGDPS